MFTNTHPALPDFWHPVALSAEVSADPVGVRLGGQGFVLARMGGADGGPGGGGPPAGIVAFCDVCPHRRARLSAGTMVDGTLQCRYHGWRYAADGRCVAIPALGDDASIPARATLTQPAAVAEQDGLVWLAQRTPRAPRPSLALPAGPAGPLEGDGIATVMLPAMRVPANGAILVDNFLDEAHLPFVHAATIGGAGPEPIPRPDIDRHGLAFTAVREHTFTNLKDPAVKDGSRPSNGAG